MKVGLVVHSGREESREHAVLAARLLEEQSVDVRVADVEELPADLDGRVVSTDGFATGLDLAISFGGDGTFLRAAHLCRDVDVPVLGVNLGRLGFLAEVELDELHAAMLAVARRDFTVETRSTLDVTVFGTDGQQLGSSWALNELSVEKSARQRLLRMDVHVGDRLFAKVPADALVIATTTGSTAYALSAGGPIVSPALNAVLVVPVAPHTLFDRTLVCGPDEIVRVDIGDDQPPAIVSVDGRDPVTIHSGGHVVARGSGKPVQLARVQPLDFYTLVRRKFGLR